MSAWRAAIAALSRREALLAHALRDLPLARAASLVERLRWGQAPLAAWLERREAASPEAGEALREHLARAASPVQTRVGPVHESWVTRELEALPPSLRPQASAWLRDGAPACALEPLGAARQRALRWCVARFPIGPAHLPASPSLPGPLLSRLCAAPACALERVLDHLGLEALALAVHGEEPRRLAALIARLEPGLQGAFQARLLDRRDDASRARLRLLAQSSLLRLRDPAAELTGVIRRLGVDLLAAAAAHRFVLEGRLLVARLPHALGASLARRLARLSRRSPALVAAAQDCLQRAWPLPCP